jgi:hypothetical protein
MSTADYQPKLIYLARRNPRLSREAFVARWRRHGALGMSLPRWKNIARYVHCDVQRPTTPAPELEFGYDGIGIIWHRSPEARGAHLADTSSRLAMERDEEETFAEPISMCCVLARETVILPPEGSTQGFVKLHVFWMAPAAGTAPVRRMSGREPGQQEMAAAGASPRGHVINVPVVSSAGTGWGLACDCVEEWWFDNERAALRAAPILKTAARGADVLIMLTGETQFYTA